MGAETGSTLRGVSFDSLSILEELGGIVVCENGGERETLE